MWNEIREKAKFNLFYLYINLATDKNKIEYSNRLISPQDNYPRQTLDTVYNGWKCINEIYIENEFILI